MASTSSLARAACLVLAVASHAIAGGNEYEWWRAAGCGCGYGYSLAQVGDVDGDAVVDFLVGVPEFPGFICSSVAGEAVLYSGATRATLASFDGECNDYLGTAVAGVGDVNQDGVPDLAIGAIQPKNICCGPGTGFVDLFSGKTHAFLYQLRPAPGDVDGHFGAAIAALGDVSGDGVADVAVGQPYKGRVHVYSGATGQELFVVTGNYQFGSAIARFRDLDGDGVTDFIVGSFKENLIYFCSGASGAFLGSRGGIGGKDDFGYSFAVLDDLTGDHIPELLVGAPQFDVLSGFPPGYVRLLDGNSGSELVTIFGDQDGSKFGWSCASAGDLDGDGRGDFVVGAPWGGPGLFAGEFMAYSGSTLLQIFRHAGTASFQELGWSMVGVGNLGGNAQDDVLVGCSDAGGGAYSVLGMSWHERWVNLGFALPGSQGLPQLAGKGNLISGESFTLALTNAASGAPTLLVAGAKNANIPFFGGRLVPSLDFLLLVATDSSGQFKLTAPWPADVPPATTAHFQMWIIDAAGPKGASASNAIVGTTP